MALATLVNGLILLSIPWLILEIVAHYSRQLAKRVGGYTSLRRRGSVSTGTSATSSNASSPSKPLLSAALRVQSTLRDASRPSLTGQKRFRGGLALSRTRFTIKLETTAFNAVPALFLRILGVKVDARRGGASGSDKEYEKIQASRRPSAKTKSVLQRIYHVGAIAGTIATAFSFGLLVLATLRFVSDLFQSSDDKQASGLYRRGLFEEEPPSSSRSLQLVPLIPGLTLPWEHLIPLGVALILVQVIHEAGHAICAAIYGIRPLSMGVMLIYPALPGAFVVLPPSTVKEDKEADEALDFDRAERGGEEDDTPGNVALKEAKSLTTAKRIEIVMAGVWHNALSAAVMTILVFMGMSSLMHALFWKPTEGLRIHDIDADSPLSKSFVQGSLIKGVDDTRLSNITTGDERLSTWTSYLAEYDRGTRKISELGWCIPQDVWQNASTACCDRLDQEDGIERIKGMSEEVCFVESPHSLGRCPDPLTITESDLPRCSVECNVGVCVRPDQREDVLRLTVQSADASEAKVILFQGEGAALTAAFTLTTEDFALSAAPGLESLYMLLALVWQYTLTLSIAMSLFNLLPLPGLDGDAFLSILVGAATGSGARRGWLPNAKTLEQMQGRLHVITIVLTAVVFGGSTLLHASRT